MKFAKKKKYSEALLKQYQDFISVLDLDANIKYLSPAYERKFGRSIRGRISQSAYKYIHQDDLPYFKSCFCQIVNSDSSVTFDIRLKDAEGNWIYMEANGINSLNDKNINGIIINFWDITIRKAQEQELKKTNEAKNKLFSIIGHDLRGLAGTGKMLTDYILENKENVNKEEIIVLLSKSQQTNDSLLSVLNNLLEWSRNQLDKITYRPAYHQLSSLINENISIFHRMANEKGISISTKGNIGSIGYFDKEQINIVIRNLILNAIKYSYKATDVFIEISSSETSLRCAFHDNGVGITIEKQKKLFLNGFSESMPGTNNETGSGLGLKLCQEFVENNKGRIWVESEERKGSSFYFTLPLKANIHNT